IEEWRQFLESVRIEQPADQNQALGMLQELTRGSPPPYGSLMRQVSYNTHLEDLATVQSGVGAAVAQATGGVVGAIRQRLGTAGAAGGAANAALNRALAGNQGERLYER